MIPNMNEVVEILKLDELQELRFIEKAFATY